MRFLILAHCDDDTALRVYVALKTRYGTQHVKLLSDEELVFAAHWAHRLDHTGVTTALLLSDGTALPPASLAVVLNRLRYAVMPHFARATEADRQYAVMEMQALWLSWLASLSCPVVNRVTPAGLGVQPRSQAEWLLLAGQAGLPTQAYHFTTNARRFPAPPVDTLSTLSDQRQSVLIAGHRLIGELASAYAVPLRRLAGLVGCDLLQVIFTHVVAGTAHVRAGEGWQVCSVNSFPHFSTAEAIAAVVEMLEVKGTQVVRLSNMS